MAENVQTKLIGDGMNIHLIPSASGVVVFDGTACWALLGVPVVVVCSAVRTEHGFVEADRWLDFTSWEFACLNIWSVVNCPRTAQMAQDELQLHSVLWCRFCRNWWHWVLLSN